MSRLDPRRYLLARTVAWFLLSVAVITAVAALLLGAELRFGGESPVLERLGGHDAAAVLLYDELSGSPSDYWDETFTRYREAYSSDIAVGLLEGGRIAGDDISVPDGIRDKVRNARPVPPERGAGRGPQRRMRRQPEVRPEEGGYMLAPFPEGVRPRFMYLGHTPEGYWAAFRVPIVTAPGRPPVQGYILARSDSVTGAGLFFNPLPWVVAVAVLLVLSAALWIPFVRGITVPIGRMTAAAERIAGGRFDMRVDEDRHDEIGRLGEAVNVMSARLEDYMKGQKRFLGDIAHELASPIARMELGLELLRSKVAGAEEGRVSDISEEVRHMSSLVEELLSFTRAELGPDKTRIEPVEVCPLLGEVAARDGAEADVRVECDESLYVYGDSGLIRRALSNLLRNAVKYAGRSGPIVVSAERRGHTVALAVSDTGQGVPDGQTALLFEPFYRTDASRSRETGGVGLGLAIVRTCATACGGTVRAENLKPRGFRVEMELKAAQ